MEMRGFARQRRQVIGCEYKAAGACKSHASSVSCLQGLVRAVGSWIGWQRACPHPGTSLTGLVACLLLEGALQGRLHHQLVYSG